MESKAPRKRGFYFALKLLGTGAENQSSAHQQHCRNDRERCGNQQRSLGAEALPETTSDHAGEQSSDARHEVENAERASAGFSRDCIDYHRLEHRLRESVVEAVESH